MAALQQKGADSTEHQHLPAVHGSADTENVTRAPQVDNRAAEADFSSLVHEIKILRSKVARLERKSLTVKAESDSENPSDSDLDDSSVVDDSSVNDDNGSNDWDSSPPIPKKQRLPYRKARQIDSKVNRVQQKIPQNEVASERKIRGRETFSKNDTTETTPLTLYTISLATSSLRPALNKAWWPEFKKKNSNSVIDVLLGSPEVVWNPWSQFTSKKTNDRKKKLISVPRPPPRVEVEHPGVDPLPERIRINSRLLLSILAEIQNTPSLYGEAESVVFLRPYKLLAYYHQDLQDWYQRLLKKHEQSKEAAPKTPALVDESLEVPPPMVKSQASSEEQQEMQVDENATTTASAEIRAMDSALAQRHMRPLIEFLEVYVLARQTYLEGEACKKVTFHDLWLLFKPGDVVVESSGNQAYRVLSVFTQRHIAIPPWTKMQTANRPPLPPPPPPPQHVMPPPPPPPPLRSRQATLGPDSRFYGENPHLPSDPRFYAGDDKPFVMSCVHIDTDGDSVGPVQQRFEVQAYEGEKLITDLPLYPLRFRTTPIRFSKDNLDTTSSLLTVREQLVERGKRFMELTTIRHVYYAGPAYKSRNILDGQMVIDNSEVFLMDARRRRPIFKTSLDATPPTPPDVQLTVCSADCCADDTVWNDTNLDLRRNKEYHHRLLPLSRNEVPPLIVQERLLSALKKEPEKLAIEDDDYIVMSDRVFGFALRSRKWTELDLAYISEVRYQLDEPSTAAASKRNKLTKTSFDELVLPPGHRKLILSLVAQHFRDEEHHDVDIFRGKGKGLILLLHGAPGVGKTSTAEGVAEAFRKPLLQITCGDLGSTAKEVEEALERNFALASRWDCVLLLDEADVFLASRSKASSGADLNRNALVAVFLRVLEYYTGILFLTTNRIGDFDEAFASRIHVSLKYPALDRDSTKKILALNIRIITERFKKNGRMIEVDEMGIGAAVLGYWDKHEKARLNGRQIRNACQTAVALAEFEAQGGSHETILDPDATVQLESTHFDIVFNAYLEFNRYLKAIHGTFQDEHAGEMGWRAAERNAQAVMTSSAQPPKTRAHPSSFPGRDLYPQNAQNPVSKWQEDQDPSLQRFNQRARPSHEHEHHSSPGPASRNIVSSSHEYPMAVMRGEERFPSTGSAERGVWEGAHETIAGHNAPYPARQHNAGPQIQHHEQYQGNDN
ncbi:hypothetical protein M3J09_012598 [Ascochyta lentis]